MENIFSSKKMPMLLLIAVMITSVSCISSRRSIAIEEGWELLGEQKVNFVRDVDEIQVNSRSRFTAIQFKIEDREVNLSELKIFFDNGDKLEPSVNEIVAPGRSSREIAIASEGRYINKISFKYRTTGNILKGRANLLVFGKKYNQSTIQ
jgi:hypothetical protein